MHGKFEIDFPWGKQAAIVQPVSACLSVSVCLSVLTLIRSYERPKAKRRRLKLGAGKKTENTHTHKVLKYKPLFTLPSACVVVNMKSFPLPQGP